MPINPLAPVPMDPYVAKLPKADLHLHSSYSDGMATIPQLLDHVEHIANIAGDDHVSIGTDGAVLPTVLDSKAIEAARQDYEQRHAAGIAAPGEGPDVFPLVRDYNSIDKLERLGRDIMKRGWTARRVEKLLGLNLVRLYGDVWGG